MPMKRSLLFVLALPSAAADEHWVNAPISSGSIGESGDLSVEFKVESAKVVELGINWRELTTRPDGRAAFLNVRHRRQFVPAHDS